MKISTGWLLALLMAAGHEADAQRRSAGQPSKPAGRIMDRESRTAAREQALAELDDPDRLVRAAALEDILDGRDALLKVFAGRKVLAGTDGELKAMFVRSRIADPARQFTMTLVDCVDLVRHKTDYCTGNLARGAVAVFFRTTEGSDQFAAYSTESQRRGTGYEAFPGSFSGNRISFMLSLYGRTMNYPPCRVELLVGASEQASGQMTCDTLRFSVRMPVA